ncbi:type II toxin-antitoxin system Phd/YefM family antitoxin [Spiribacter roseus]|uniref:type II toxin-antitoxin system Phd/YefM family antitoxin n=1 Tax=Spiribacter roseus TaxID=1855875 RepID=UPI00384A7882
MRMDGGSITLSKARAHIHELADRAERGESVTITRHGRPVVRLVPVEVERRPINADRLRALTDQMPMAEEEFGLFMRRAREGERF